MHNTLKAEGSTHPKGMVEPHAAKWLVSMAVTVVAIETLLAALAWLSSSPPTSGLGPPYQEVRDVVIVAELAWRGSWVSLLFLWCIGTFPWRESGGQPAIVLLVALVLLAGVASAFGEMETLWALAYGAVVAVWLLTGRLFGLRIGHRTQLNQPLQFRWSLLTTIAIVTASAVVIGIWMAIWRWWVYEREHSSGWFVGLLQFLLLAVMVLTFCQAALLVAALGWRWASYLSLYRGPLFIVAILSAGGRGEIQGLILFCGFCLLANGILGTMLHYYGWRVFLDTPVWDRKRDVRFYAPSNL